MTVRFVRNSAGFRALLSSPEMAEMLRRKAEAVKEAAESDTAWDRRVSGDPGDETIPYTVTVEQHNDRKVSRVTAAHPAALNVEVKHRVLGRAIDAAR